MKVRFVQAGGFVGAVTGCELETAALAPEAAQELKRLVRDSGISVSGQLLSESGRDLQEYEIVIEDANRKISVVFDDLSIPNSARLLLGFVKKYARPMTLN